MVRNHASPSPSYRGWEVGRCKRCPDGTSTRDHYSNINKLRWERGGEWEEIERKRGREVEERREREVRGKEGGIENEEEKR